MNDHDSHEVQEALRQANNALAEGARAGARPGWYPYALGLSVAFALGSFAVPWLTMGGVVLGGILIPLALEEIARRRTGASPVKTYFAPGVRMTTSIFLTIGGALCASALILLKTTGDVSFVLIAAPLLGIVTTICTWSVGWSRRSGRSEEAAAQ